MIYKSRSIKVTEIFLDNSKGVVKHDELKKYNGGLK